MNIVNVIDRQIAPCQGCFGCWARGDGHCVMDDDQNAILDLYRDADVIIQLKMVREADGTVRHETLVDFSRIHTLVICGCGFPRWDGNFDGLKQMCKTCFGNPDMVCVPETPLLNVPEAAIVADPLLERFEKAGKEYGISLSLSDETIAALEEPMIPAEEYIRQVNRSQD